MLSVCSLECRCDDHTLLPLPLIDIIIEDYRAYLFVCMIVCEVDCRVCMIV